MAGLAAGMAGPTGHHPGEVDIEHDAAEIEQQRVGGVGGERRIHGSRLQNWTGLSNGRGLELAPNLALKPAPELC
jgi:hypothetical protein